MCLCVNTHVSVFVCSTNPSQDMTGAGQGVSNAWLLHRKNIFVCECMCVRERMSVRVGVCVCMSVPVCVCMCRGVFASFKNSLCMCAKVALQWPLLQVSVCSAAGVCFC